MYDLPMSDVDWLALWAEFAQAAGNEQLEVAERTVYFDGRWDFSEVSSSRLLATARQIIRERASRRKILGSAPFPPRILNGQFDFVRNIEWGDAAHGADLFVIQDAAA
jgi:hypothetical protein